MSDEPDSYTSGLSPWRPWLIAEDVYLETPFVRGRFVVEDVEESQRGPVTTTTYTLRSLDLDDPFGIYGYLALESD